MSAITQPTNAEELLYQPDDGFRYELVKGEIRKMSPAGVEHGAIIAKLTWRIAQHVETNQLGIICGAETGFKIATNPDTVRAPDIAFVSRERIPEGGLPKGFWPGAPDLAVEVTSPRDSFEEVEEKVGDWLAAGAKAVWIVNPKRRTVTIYRALNDVAILTDENELDGQRVVPGFRCRVADIFV